MGNTYLRGRPWSSWTREERYFCAVLFCRARHEPAAFASWLIDAAGLSASCEGDWELGFEVCFYRDYLWQLGQSARECGLPAKRTFDLCLFGERDLIVVEAKVCEAYGGAQNEDFALDRARINSLPGLEDVSVHLVALASSQYFSAAARRGRPGTLAMFDGRLSWSQVAGRYPDPVLQQADAMYRLRRDGAFCEPIELGELPG